MCTPTTSLRVRNLALSVDNEALFDLFESAGATSATVIKEFKSRESKVLQCNHERNHPRVLTKGTFVSKILLAGLWVRNFSHSFRSLACSRLVS